jgi:hypothetical protein
LGTPNNGTPLALDVNLVRFLDGHVAMLARTPSKVAHATLEGVLCLARCVALNSSEHLPGLAALTPGSPTLRTLAAFKPTGQQWFTIGAQFAAPGGHGDTGERDEFFTAPNDLVVSSDGCHEPGVQVADSLRLGGADVHHHNYFSNEHVRDRLARWLQ